MYLKIESETRRPTDTDEDTRTSTNLAIEGDLIYYSETLDEDEDSRLFLSGQD